MNITQSLKKAFYPTLKAIGKLAGINFKAVINTDEFVPNVSVYNFVVFTNQGEKIELEQFKGKYIMLVNTASDCGYTAQYTELQKLRRMYADQLEVIAFPSNNFGGQEPASNDEIANFCAVNFGVQFPIIMKSDVTGSTKNEVFDWLTDPAKNGWNDQEPSWNFCKYIINPDGILVGFFESAVSPLDKEILKLLYSR